MKMVVERDTAIAEVLLSDGTTSHGYRHVTISAQADTAANAADLARDVASFLCEGRDTWWRTPLECRQEGEIGSAFSRFSFAPRLGQHRDYDSEWRDEHASLLGFR